MSENFRVTRGDELDLLGLVASMSRIQPQGEETITQDDASQRLARYMPRDLGPSEPAPNLAASSVEEPLVVLQQPEAGPPEQPVPGRALIGVPNEGVDLGAGIGRLKDRAVQLDDKSLAQVRRILARAIARKLRDEARDVLQTKRRKRTTRKAAGGEPGVEA